MPLLSGHYLTILSRCHYCQVVTWWYYQGAVIVRLLLDDIIKILLVRPLLDDIIEVPLQSGRYCYIKVLKVKPVYQQTPLSPKLGVVEISTLWHLRLPLLIQMFIKVVSSPRLFFPQTVRDWNALPDSLIPSGGYLMILSRCCYSQAVTWRYIHINYYSSNLIWWTVSCRVDELISSDHTIASRVIRWYQFIHETWYSTPDRVTTLTMFLLYTFSV